MHREVFIILKPYYYTKSNHNLYSGYSQTKKAFQVTPMMTQTNNHLLLFTSEEVAKQHWLKYNRTLDNMKIAKIKIKF